ncbi:MAG: rhodanese-like domain-containing protein [Alphaproteobacteria bacterium]|nr:rhodanese-like domain-containing protein [Alphaproteobacteria bacterium]
MTTHVTEIPAAPADEALRHFEAKLTLETDCYDVHASLQADPEDFVLIDVRSPTLFAEGHIDGAINIPHGKMTARRMAGFPDGTTFVVYCAGPHCNGADKGAIRLARLGLPVKLMIGGVTGWLDEGFVLTPAPSAVP